MLAWVTRLCGGAGDKDGQVQTAGRVLAIQNPIVIPGERQRGKGIEAVKPGWCNRLVSLPLGQLRWPQPGIQLELVSWRIGTRKRAFVRGWLVLLLMPVWLPVTILAAAIIPKKADKRTPSDVAQEIREYLSGGGGDLPMDRLKSVPIADPELEALRRQFLKAETEPLTAKGREQLEAVLLPLDVMQEQWLKAGRSE